MVRIVFCVLWRTWGEALLDFRHENRRNATRFSSWNLALILNTLRKHQSRPYPFWNQTSKPNPFKAPKVNANSLFLITNVLKLRFYQNKGLSTDRRCGVRNTFPTRNQTSELKNQDFLPIHIRLGKMLFSLA